MGMDTPADRTFTELVIGQRFYHYQTDMLALETAESLPEHVKWQVKLQHDKGIVDSEKYKSTKGR